LEQIPHCSVLWLGLGKMGTSQCWPNSISCGQATTLLKFAKSVRDSNASAALVEKAADLRDRVDETMPPVDPSPHALDVEPPAQSSA
jgi:hypothetical protein